MKRLHLPASALVVVGCAGGPPAQPPHAVDLPPVAPGASGPSDGAAASRTARHGVLSEDAMRAAVLRRLATPAPPSPCTDEELPAQLRGDAYDDASLHTPRWIGMAYPDQAVAGGTCAAYDAVVHVSNRYVGVDDGKTYDLVLLDAATRKPRSFFFGLTTLAPYDLRASTMPLLDGESLRVKADLWGIVANQRQKTRSRALRCSIAAITRDSDGDGASDLEEAWLVTDPADPDTDGDGLPDGADPAPLGTAPAATPEQQVWLAAYRAMFGTPWTDATIVVASAGPRLDVRGLSSRLVQLRPDEVERYAAKLGRIRPHTIDVTMKGAGEASFVVDAVDAGSPHAARRSAAGGEWEIDP